MVKADIKKIFKIQKNRKPIYDYIRVLSCMAVIGIHVTGDRTDLVGLLMEDVFRIGLTMFFLLSGALNLNRKTEEPLGKFYYKMFKRLVIPLFLYGLYYSEWLQKGHKILAIPSWNSLKEFIMNIPAGLSANLTTYQSVHLWFMYEIIGLYIIIPFLRKALQAMDRKMLMTLAILILLLMACTDYLPAFGQGFGITNYFDHWIIYLIFGYILVLDASAVYYKYIGLLGVITYAGAVWIKYAHAGFAGRILNYYDLAPHMLIQTCGVFVLFLLSSKYLTHFKWLNQIMYVLGKYTFAIYLIHMYILQWLIQRKGNDPSVHGILTTILIVFALSFVFAVIFDNVVTKNIQRLCDGIEAILKKIINTKNKKSMTEE